MELTNSVTMTGVGGRVLWGYQEAATFKTWELTGNADGARVHAVASTLNTLRSTQRPLVFAVTRPKGVWRWPITSALQIHGSAVTFTVGPCEE